MSIRCIIAALLLCAAQSQDRPCSISVRAAPLQKLYRVGVLAIRGADIVMAELNTTFGEYLSLAVGRKFDPPISFETVPVDFETVYTDLGQLDFVHVNPSIFSCIDSEVGANSLVTQIAERKVNGEEFHLTEFGGVIFTKASNDEINSIEDIRGKKVAAAAISGLGSGQMQFRELQRRGLHHFQDPQQLIFTRNQGKVVRAVMEGIVDVGFVRTDQLERSIDPNTGQLLNVSHIKIIGTRDGLVSNGKLFPFQSSTSLYPEWNVASLASVPPDVAREVQSALLSLQEHAAIAPPLLACYESRKCETIDCRDACFADLDPEAFQRCDTTAELAVLAQEAMVNGKHGGFIPTMSYMELRNMQEQIQFINPDPETKKVRCLRAVEIDDAVVCPPRHFKKSDEDIEGGCMAAGLDCFGFQCLCSPCVKAYDVDFFPLKNEVGLHAGSRKYVGCAKFAICGEVEQGDSISFVAVDNKGRDDAIFSVNIILVGEENEWLHMSRSNDTKIVAHEFEFYATSRRTGVVIIEVYANAEQITESPFRLSIVERDCEYHTGDGNRVPDPWGECVCGGNTIEIANGCTLVSIVLSCALVASSVVVTVLVYLYVEHKRKQADSVWLVNPQELVFDDPPKILGRGKFGLVLLAEYRGTHTAVKRVLPPERDASGGVSYRLTNSSDFVIDLEGAVVAEESGGRATINCDVSTRDCEGEFGMRRGHVESGTQLEREFALSRFSRKAKKYAKMKAHFIKEMRYLSKLRHPNITTVLGAVISNEPMLVLEHMQLGSLYDLLHNESMILEGDLIHQILLNVSQGIRFLHSATPMVVHGDLKAQNILVDSKFHAKVADFFTQDQSRCTGTDLWMAPELLRGEATNSTETDIYSFGVVLYEVFSRKDPYEGEDQLMVLQKIADKKINMRPPVPDNCPLLCAQLMQECWEGNPEERPTAVDIDRTLKSVEMGGVDPLGENGRPEDFIYQLFPRHIAEALREGRKVEPESFDCVTVYFSDICQYTNIAATLSPEKVSDLLDRLYTKFDYLCGIHSVFKVETVGDAYMTVTNVEIEQPEHVRIMARFAFDAVKAASETLIDTDEPERGFVTIRCGFHTGAIVSNVVGTRNQRFSIIGDTVNTSSRMEANSEPGRVHCSEESAMMLRDQAPDVNVVCRGTINVKGKGQMVTYWVEPSDTNKPNCATNEEDSFSI